MILVSSQQMRGQSGVTAVGEPIKCAEGGVAIMARKDSKKKMMWFDEGLKKLMNNGDYKWLCDINSVGQYCNFGRGHYWCDVLLVQRTISPADLW